MAGRFITLEGGEGAGKSTQIAAVAGHLRAHGLDVLTTREPGGAPGAEAIRALLVEGDPGRWDATTEMLLHFAARRDHLARTVWPALDAGTWVVCDRFADSTVAYQGYGHGLGPQPVRDLYALAVGDFRPDLTLILDLPVETGLARTGTRDTAETRYERMDAAFHQRVRDGFHAIAAAEPDRCVLIDAAPSPDQVTAAITAAVDARFASQYQGA